MNKKADSKGQLSNLLFNIVLPVIVLQKLDIGNPVATLVIALAFPVAYSIYDYLKEKKVNAFSIIGFVNVLLTGGLALLKVEGIWFAVKEMAIPLVIGLGVLYTAFTIKPLIRLFIFNEATFKVDLIEEKLKENGTAEKFLSYLKTLTLYLAGSFFVSAALNFFLAVYIFTEIPQTLSEAQRSVVLNQQIADMTWKSYIVILVPSMIMMGGIFWRLSKALRECTGFKFTELLQTDLS